MEIEEKIILLLEIISYMVDENVPLEKAYEDKGVSKEMRMSMEEIVDIVQKFLKESTKK